MNRIVTTHILDVSSAAKIETSSWHMKKDGTLALLCCNVALASGVESVEIFGPMFNVAVH